MGSKERFYVDIQSLNNGVTGSCHLCIVKYPDGSSCRFIVDCGLFQGIDEEKDYNKDFPFNEDSISFALITHNHVDHVGRLPLLVKNGFSGKIYCTQPTSELLPLALFDSYKVLKDVCKRKHEGVLYSDSDVTQTLRKVVGVPFSSPIYLTENVKATFLKNGHLVGAAVILVEISFPGVEQNINLMFTGDYNNKNIFFDVDPIPKEILDLPINIIQESTYGSMSSDEIEFCFEQNVLSFLKKNGTIVIPVFSLGRSQEILYILRKWQDEGKISLSIPIYFDGKLARRYTDLYLKNKLSIKEEMVDFLPHDLQYVDSENREDVLNDNNCKIILTTSGMGSYGPAQLYIPTFIRKENALIHFTGYTAEGTLGRRLKNTPIGESVQIGGLLLKKMAHVEYTSEFSAHAKSDEMIKFLQQFTRINFILINHGQPNVKDLFARKLLKNVKAKDIGISSREFFFRITPYHLCKTLTTKFQ